MSQKVILKLYIKSKARPLFKCEIVDDVERIIKDLENSLNDKNADIVHFGQVCFKRTEFRYFEIIYK